MLDARLAAEAGTAVTPPVAAGPPLVARPRRRAARCVVREPASASTSTASPRAGSPTGRWTWSLGRARVTTALVDGDGDIAACVAAGDELHRRRGRPARSRTAPSRSSGSRPDDGRRGPVRARDLRHQRPPLAATAPATAHHLIDPVTWRPAETDVVQATVLADTARTAEAFAKAAVLAGSDLAPELLDRPGVHGALLLTTRGEIRATPGMLPWLA